ncbi:MULTISPECIES: hypothetical protein [Pseudomonas]|uniref:Uncharacterized protein n=1 Tax=Pseudomonas sessilinigenes TaxID=658629 RepID=A0ABX8MIR1_9PSED|nr:MULTISPECIES: hypothetical protein [Pseudomonas]AZC26857.1 hypothetical protein C4K39_5212 [Pseudomonas sessilinigenes]QIH07841.1 hypothetical protein ATY02_14550 [Pseudomonas sp. BIOMIG1BAC]QXH39169.1 hypothetical protein KSS89_23465 [Pseudomonas sessilinigenes]
MKSWIKTLLVTLLAAALCLLFARVVLPPVLMLIMLPSWEGGGWYWANLLLAGFLAGLLVAPLLPAQRFYPVPLLLLLSALLVLHNWSESRCNDAQLQAIEQLAAREASHAKLELSNEQMAPSDPAPVNKVPGVRADEQGYGFSYSCIRPGETLSRLLPLSMSYGAGLLGLLLALLIVPRRRTVDALP